METSFITPMNTIEQIKASAKTMQTNSVQSNDNLFKSIFENAINDVKETENNLQYQQYLLATGQLDDPHTLQIAASEAQLSTNMLVQLRNKALDAYNELIRISV